MLIVLTVNNKVEFVDGSLLQPMMNSSLFRAWKCNNMVASWLAHSILIFVRKSILRMDKTIDIWKDLKA